MTRSKALGIVLGALLAIPASAKLLIEWQADRAARELLGSLNANGQQQAVTAATLRVHQAFLASARDRQPMPLLQRVRPYLTHPLLPSMLRVEEGAIDALYTRGLCDSAARTLAFALNHSELQVAATQLNMVNPYGGHSVTEVRTPAGEVWLLDPLYAVAPQQEGRLIGALRARDMARLDTPMDELWLALAPTSTLDFYQHFDQVSMARQGEPLRIDIHVKLAPGQHVTLGQIDNDTNDVYRDGARLGWTSYLTYLGSKYDRSWQRALTFHQDTEVAFNLTSKPDPRFITTDIKPVIDGQRVIYRMREGQQLAFIDGAARRDWLRFKSYQDVDAIVFKALP